MCSADLARAQQGCCEGNVLHQVTVRESGSHASTLALGPRTVLILAFALTISSSSLLVARTLGLPLVPVSVLQPAVGILHLTLTPGVLLLGVIGARFANAAESLVYTVATSMTVLMVVGLLVNLISSQLGVRRPMDPASLAVGLSVVIALLGILYYHRNRQREGIWRLPLPSVHQLLLQGVVLGAVILGARLFVSRSVNWLILAVIPILAIAPLVSLRIRRPRESTSLLVRDAAILWTVALCILWFRALSQQYLDAFGDPYVERYFAGVVQEAGRWDPSIQYIHNAMLVEVVLQPLLAGFLGISLDNVFKFVYPLLFAMAPVAVYCLNRREFGREVGLVSTFLIIYNPVFFNDYAQATRWGMAMFFLASIMMLMTDKDATPQRNALIMIFSFSLITTHYTTAYIFMASLMVLCGATAITRTIGRAAAAEPGIPARFLLSYTALFVVALFAWYSNLAGGAGISFLEYASVIWSGGLIPYPGAARWVLHYSWPPSVLVTAILTFLIILLGGLGWMQHAALNLRRDRNSVRPAHLLLTMAYATPLALFALVGSGRALFMSLLLLAPYSVCGLMLVRRIVGIIWRQNAIREGIVVHRWAHATACFVAAGLLLFSSGFMAEAFIKGDDYAPTVFVSRKRLYSINDPYFTFTLFRSYVPTEDVIAARWFKAYRSQARRVYVDGMPEEASIGAVTLVGYGLIPPNDISPLGTAGEIQNGYVFLRSYSNALGLLFRVAPFEAYSVSDIRVMDMQAIYSNGLAEVFSSKQPRPLDGGRW